ncbi:MAG: DUF2931 family protein, partial [Chitinophagaceae bacterium]
WYPTECAPRMYPIEIVTGNITTEDSTQISVPAGKIMYNGWGELGSTFISDPIRKATPTKLSIHWFSYAEDQFYGGDFTLPTDSIRVAFKEGYTSPFIGEQKTFSSVMIGMAPNGAVVVWLKGDLLCREVAFFNAQKEEGNWKAICSNTSWTRKEYVEAQLHETLDSAAITLIKKQRTSQFPDLWNNTYRERFKLLPNFVTRSTITQVICTYFNGEVEMLTPESERWPRVTRPLPKSYAAYWTNPVGQKLGGEIEFDFEELEQAIAAFKREKADLTNDALSIQVEINSVDHTISNPILRDGERQFPLHKVSMRSFGM